MIRKLLYDLLVGRRIRRYRRRRRRWTPTRIVAWIVRKIVMSVLVFVVLGVLILWHFHAGAMEAIAAGDASVLSALPLVLGRWVELGVAFVVSVFAVFVPGGNDDDNYS